MSAPRKDYGCPLRIYDAPVFAERYTCLPPRSLRAARAYRNSSGSWDCLCLSASAWGHHSTAQPGPHLGQRIHWRDLPHAVQAALRNSFLSEYCPKEG